MSSATLQVLEPVPSEGLAADESASIAEEAARYAVLRRLGSAIRHQIAGALQPVTMVASLVERRVQAPSPNLEALQRNCSEMSALARSASTDCVALMGWLAPHAGEYVALHQGIEECLHLLTTELSFRGFTVVDTTQGQHASVARLSLRTLVPACLMVLTDTSELPAQLRIAAQADASVARVSLTLVPSTDATTGVQRAKAYRPLTWSDVRALARAEGVELEVAGDGVELQFAVRQAPEDDAQVRWG